MSRLAVFKTMLEAAPDKTGAIRSFTASALEADAALADMSTRYAGDMIGTFTDPVWKAWKACWGVKWDTLGAFVGAPPSVEIRGPLEYVFRQKPNYIPFRFIRSNGEVIAPGTMITDGGSIPRVAWSIPGLDPWTYIWAYLIHDWQFMAHHCVSDCDYNFAGANDTLAEAVYTLMMMGQVPQDWRTVAIIHAGCSSWVGKAVWNRVWTPDECQRELNP